MEKESAAAIKIKEVMRQTNFRNRAARLYWYNHESTPIVMSQRVIRQHINNDATDRLGSPLVVASIAAGVIGVAIIAFILLGVWVRTKFTSSRFFTSNRRNQTSEGIEEDRECNTAMSSLSSLNNETLFDTIELDDSVFIQDPEPILNTEEKLEKDSSLPDESNHISVQIPIDSQIV